MKICVYCSSSSAIDACYTEMAREFGTQLAQRGHALVYGGGNMGLMGELAAAVRMAKGQVVAVIPRKLRDYGLLDKESDEVFITETMAERKAKMEELGEAFVALPGGFGTLEELLQVLTLNQLDYLQKPVVLLNTAGFYDVLLAHFEKIFEEHFAKPDYRELYHVANTPQAALAYVEGYRPAQLPRKWY